eukprot:364082-Chlamydomonas_euryale.AAC.2
MAGGACRATTVSVRGGMTTGCMHRHMGDGTVRPTAERASASNHGRGVPCQRVRGPPIGPVRFHTQAVLCKGASSSCVWRLCEISFWQVTVRRCVHARACAMCNLAIGT